MSTQTLAISSVATLLTGILYIYIGHVLRRRRVSADARLANGMFVLWWQSLGYISVLAVAINALYMAKALQIWVYQSYVLLVLLVLFAALWGLQFYLVFLYTGSRRSFVRLGVFYALLFAATVVLVQRAGPPASIVDDGWTLKTEPMVTYGLAFNLVFVLLIVGPQIVAAIFYARLCRKTSDRTQRYRIALVTSSILVWFGSSVLATAANASTALWWQLTSRAIGIAGAVVILWAYKPPMAVRRKYAIRSIDDEPPGAPS